ncbi:hypothetical protein CVT26_011655, partial [Gymnopilus dilepis]
TYDFGNVQSFRGTAPTFGDDTVSQGLSSSYKGVHYNFEGPAKPLAGRHALSTNYTAKTNIRLSQRRQ